jgi:MFS family permease
VNRNLWLVLSGIFCVFATQTIAFVLIPLAAVSMGLPGSAIGLLVAVLAGLGLATDMLVAVISDHLGRRAPMLLGTALGVAAGGILSFASDFVGLLTGAIAFGLSLSLAVGPSLAYVTEACRPRDAARVQGYNGAIQGLSALAGAIVIGLAVERLGSRPSAWLIAGLMALAFTAFAGLAETVNRSKLRSLKELLGGYTSAIRMLTTRPQLQLSAFVSLIFNSVVFVVGNSFLPLYIVHDLSESAVLAGGLLATRNVAMTVSSLFFGYAVGRFGLVRTMIGANTLAVAGVVGLSVVTDSRLLVVVLVVQGLGIGFAAATANTLVASATDRQERALGFATNSFVSRGGSLLSPLLYGVILEVSGNRAVFMAAGVLGLGYLAGMVARARLIDGYERRRWISAETAGDDGPKPLAAELEP